MFNSVFLFVLQLMKPQKGIQTVKSITFNSKKMTFFILLITLLASIVYTIYKIWTSPNEAISGAIHAKVKSDYALMLLQCLLGLIVMMIPSVIEKRFAVDIPNAMEIMYFIFLYGAIYLGEVRNFYYLILHWDTILHAFSGAMLGAMGFTLVSFLNDTPHLKLKLSPFFIALFAFCFAVASGVVWEIYEFAVDGLFGMNMQKFILADGTILSGRLALADTMQDLIVDAFASLLVAVAGYVALKTKAK